WHRGWGIGTNTTYRQLSGDATKILYFSPSFGGFSFALSYAPDRRGEDCYFGFTSICGNLTPGGTTFANNPGQISEVWSAALNFEHDFNGFSLVAGAGGAYGEIELTDDDEDVWTARTHLGVGFSGFYIGGAIAHTEMDGPFDTTTYGVGGTYNFDAWTVGLAW